MKNDIRLVTILILFMVCFVLLPLITTLPPNENQGWLSFGPAKAQSSDLAFWNVLPTQTIEVVVDPTRPSDEVDWWGRLGSFDPQTPDIRIDFPMGAVSSPAAVRAYRTQALPTNVPPPANGSVGSPFYLGVWLKGQGRTVSEFQESIVINVTYDESALSQIGRIQRPGPAIASAALSHLGLSTGLPLAMVAHPALAALLPLASAPNRYGYPSPAQEGNLRLSMYDPATETWVKLCSRTDTVGDKVSAALVLPTPLEEGGNALFALIPDDTPALDQAVDDLGNTTLSMPGSNFRLGVLAGTVEVGTHFEITRLSQVAESDLFKLLPTPVDIKACQADYTTVNRVCQVTQFPKPLKVEFDYQVDTVTRAGGRANLTVVSLQNQQWVDLEELGYRVIRGENKLTIDTDSLGTFSMAAR